jgi:hypothetical protein
MKALFTAFLFFFCTTVFAQDALDDDIGALDRQSQAMQALTTGYETKSTIEIRPFPFFESCEYRPGIVHGRDPVDGHMRNIGVVVLRKRFGGGQAVPPRRSVLILPPTGGKNRLDEQYAERLCDRGIEAWILTAWDTGEPDYTLTEDVLSHDRAGLRGISAVRQIAYQMQGTLGILGTSAGGILAAVALAVEPRFKTGVLIAAGADLPEIVANSDLQSLRALRTARMHDYHLNSDGYKDFLRKNVLLDPKWFGQELQTKTIGMIFATQDRTVPYPQQLYLRDIAHAREITSIDDDHVNTILQTGLLIPSMVLDFFDKNL